MYSQNNDHAGALKLNRLKARSLTIGKGIRNIEVRNTRIILPALYNSGCPPNGSNRKANKPNTEPKITSGRQEYLENLINRYI